MNEGVLLAHEMKFWMWLTKPHWYDLGYAHPLFAPDYHVANSYNNHQCPDLTVWEDKVFKQTQPTKE